MTTRLVDLILQEESRRGRRNIRDRLAREYIQNHPSIKQDPEGDINLDNVPDGTTESAIRGIARFYNKSSLVRKILRERRENDDTRSAEETETTDSSGITK